MFYVSRRESHCFQGDILRNVPIIKAPDTIKIARIDQATEGSAPPKYIVSSEDDIANAYQNGSEVVLANGLRTKVILLSQTCDIQNREFVVIAPIFDLDTVKNNNRKTAIKEGKINYRFYLPVSEVMPESYVDFTLLSSVRKEFINVSDRILSLSDSYRPHLVWGLNRYFCRPFLDLKSEDGTD